MRVIWCATARAAGLALSATALITLTACSAHPAHRAPATSSAAATSRSAPPATPTHSSSGSRSAPPTLDVRAVSWRLPQPLSRAVAFTDVKDIVIAGGLTSANTSTSDVSVLDPASGAVVRRGTIPVPVHDAAGFVVGGHHFVAGGGSTDSVRAVQQIGAGSVALLPRPRSDLAAVTVGTRAYLVGGYDGTTADPVILATADGRTFTTAGRLPVAVRYPAVAAVGSTIVIFGGQTDAGVSAVIQAFDTRTGVARVLGALPAAVAGAAAVTLGGSVYVCGGQSARGITDAIWRFDLRSRHATLAGRLPMPVMDPAVAQADGLAYLLGGENPQPTDHVVVLTEGRP